MPQKLQDSKLHQSLCETWCFSALVAEKCVSYALILSRTIGMTLYHFHYLIRFPECLNRL
jgi:hypothetical protein